MSRDLNKIIKKYSFNNYFKSETEDKLDILKNFLVDRNLYSYAKMLTKISMEVVEKDVLERIEKAKKERDEKELFDYSSLFEEGKDYVVLPEDGSSSMFGEIDDETLGYVMRLEDVIRDAESAKRHTGARVFDTDLSAKPANVKNIDYKKL